MRRELDEDIERRATEFRASIDQALDRLEGRSLLDQLDGEDRQEFLNDIRTLIYGIKKLKHDNQTLRWLRQMSASELKATVDLTLRQLGRLLREESLEGMTEAILRLGFFLHLHCPDPTLGEKGIIQFLAIRSVPDDIKQKARTALARKGIRITDSGDMTIDEAQILGLEEKWFFHGETKKEH